MMARERDLERLYELLAALKSTVRGYRFLKGCNGGMGWPSRGVYFFFEPGETRQDRDGLRVVRVGTHAVSAGSRTTLWKRLAQHKGHSRGRHPGGGNHRGSIFRHHVGTAFLNTGAYPEEVKGLWASARDPSVVDREYLVERDVSAHIGAMPFLWVEVPGEAGVTSDRKLIEAGAVALLSDFEKAPIDPPSPGWLGHMAAHRLVRESGLWNVDHVGEQYDPSFLIRLENHILRMGSK